MVGIRAYTRVVGVLLLLLGLGGFANILEGGAAESIFRMVLGALCVYLGFLERDVAMVRGMVGGMAAVLLFAEFIAHVIPFLRGIGPLPSPVDMGCLGLGLLSILAAKYLPPP